MLPAPLSKGVVQLLTKGVAPRSRVATSGGADGDGEALNEAAAGLSIAEKLQLVQLALAQPGGSILSELKEAGGNPYAVLLRVSQGGVRTSAASESALSDPPESPPATAAPLEAVQDAVTESAPVAQSETVDVAPGPAS